jgi:hypothetical protein
LVDTSPFLIESGHESTDDHTTYSYKNKDWDENFQNENYFEQKHSSTHSIKSFTDYENQLIEFKKEFNCNSQAMRIHNLACISS